MIMARHAVDRIFVMAIMVSVLSCQAAPAVSTEEEWQSLTDEALDHYQYGNNKEAVIVAKDAVKMAEELFGPDDLRVAGSIDNLATYLAATGRTEEADRLYRRALAMLEKKLSPDDSYLAIFMDYLAVFYGKIGNDGYAKELREHAKKIRLEGYEKSIFRQ
ncbi:MAG: tetratricopeptide repeat protein [Candidatus Omnitrophota bacterium]